MSGVAMGRALDQAGAGAYQIIERNDGVGGTWRDNHYPGAGCDIPSQLYSYSFALNAGWSRRFAGQPEILAYFERCADELGVRDRLITGDAVARCGWDGADRLWRVETASGRAFAARALIAATGQLNTPHIPKLEGAQAFAGAQFHSARWDTGLDWAGKRIVVIGNAASAIQFLPHLAETAAQVSVFQRSPNWVVSKPDRAFTAVERWLFRHAPGFQRLYRAGIFWTQESKLFAFFNRHRLAQKLARRHVERHLRKNVPDTALRALVTPDYPPGCRRVLITNDYFETLQRPNVELVTAAATRLHRDAVEAADGTLYGADAVIYATGFETTKFVNGVEVIGRDGQRLDQVWARAPKAYRGVSAPGFPNFFTLYGPNTNLGHNSIIYMVEQQCAYVARRLAKQAPGWAEEVTPEAHAAYNDALQADLAQTVWAADCGSWYATADGVVTNNWSSWASAYARLMAQADDEAYRRV